MSVPGPSAISRVNDVPAVAAEHGGVFTAAQALAEGWTARQVRRRLSSGRWTYVAGRALARPQPQWTAFQLAAAAQLSIASAVTSHLTAARLHGFPVSLEQVSHVIATSRHRSPLGIAVHSIALSAHEVTTLDGFIMITTRQRTAADCLATMPPDDGQRLWAWLTAWKVMDVAELARVIRARYNHDGTARLRDLLRQVRGGAVSAAERRCHQLLRQAGITGWAANATVRDARGIIAVADILFERQWLVIEIDGFGAHSSREAFVSDRRRQNRLVAAGYTVLRFTWDDLQHRPADVLRLISDKARH